METAMGQNNVKRLALSAIAILSIVSGCAQQTTHADDAQRVNQYTVQDMQMADAIRDSGVRAAIVSQHTLYPYDFAQGSDGLNELGQRDLAVLASHLKSNGGELNVYRGSTDSAMYDARLKHVTQALKAHGVNTDKVHIGDGQGGGESMSEDALREMRKSKTAPSKQQDPGTMSTADQTQTGYTGSQK